MKSFAAKVRDGLTRETTETATKHCCKRAELTGFAFSCGSVSLWGGGGMRLVMRTEHAGTVRRAVKFIRCGFSLAPGIRTVKASRLGGRTTFEIRLEAADAAKLAGILGLSPLDRTVPQHCLLKKCCRSAFLRGVFLGSGTLMDPKRGYRMEFLMPDETGAESLRRFLKAFVAVRAGVSERRGTYVVYIKDSDGIIAVLSLIGAHGAILEMENVRIVRDARNLANRAANCDAGNIAKILGAADRQIQAIERIERSMGLEGLPDTLREVARERRRHQDASLEELGAMLDPPLGKSGVYHRLKRIESFAQTIQEEEGPNDPQGIGT